MNIKIEDCLRFEPFEGDFISEYRVLRDKVVTARKERPCYLCKDQIKKRTKIRTRVEITDGMLHSYSWCNRCSLAMAKEYNGDDEEINELYDNFYRKKDID